MEESAEWRLRYDEEVERSRKCAAELIEVSIFQIAIPQFLMPLPVISSSRAALDSPEWISCCLH